MLSELSLVVQSTLARTSVSAEAMTAAFGAIMDGRASEIEIAALLTALASKGETAEEIAGAAAAMRARVTCVPARTAGLLDTCGTGGDRLNTFNISTATALVVAAAGVPIAKHGNRSATSTSGSAEVLQALGVNIELPPQQVALCIDEIGIGFCYARLLHSAMKHVAPVRAALGFRTIFNLLGPLTNPAAAEFQLLGTNSNATAEKLAHAVARLGTTRTLVVCGHDQLDEVALWGQTTLYEVAAGQVQKHSWMAADLDLPECSVEDLRIGSPDESADRIRSVLAGAAGPARNMIVANAAAALWCVRKVNNPADGARLAEQLLDRGTAREQLERLARWTQAAAK
ncbi:MAG: anthranilate phosphoribosyltransferase [Planctomycetaceae bacterium]